LWTEGGRIYNLLI